MWEVCSRTRPIAWAGSWNSHNQNETGIDSRPRKGFHSEILMLWSDIWSSWKEYHVWITSALQGNRQHNSSQILIKKMFCIGIFDDADHVEKCSSIQKYRILILAWFPHLYLWTCPFPMQNASEESKVSAYVWELFDVISVVETPIW